MTRAAAAAPAAQGRAVAACGAVALTLVACGRRTPITSCDDDLRGVYVAEGERWMVLDDGATLEAYPLFPDVPPALRAAGIEVAPRVLDLARARTSPAGAQPTGVAGSAPARLDGTVHRRYQRAASPCEAREPAHVTRCADDTLDVVLADPAPPLAFAPCTWPRPAPSRLVRWRRD